MELEPTSFSRVSENNDIDESNKLLILGENFMNSLPLWSSSWCYFFRPEYS